MITAIECHELRNIERLSVPISKGVTLFTGENGAGKTAVLEAVHLLAKGRSFRSGRIKEIVRDTAECLLVRADLEQDGLKQSVALSRSVSGETHLRRNGESVSRLSDLARFVPIQLLLPDVAELIFGGPNVRRQFLDWGLFHVKQSYHGHLSGYLRALKQRNAWLKQQRGSPSNEPDPWAPTLSEAADQIHKLRDDYLKALLPLLEAAIVRLGLDFEVTIQYQRGWAEQDRRCVLADMLDANRAIDIKWGSTQYGPHRAELVFSVAGSAASRRLSRGQGKALASSLHVAQAELLQRETSLASTFLIDDLGAELDTERNSRLFSALSSLNCQILATSVHEPVGLRGAVGELEVFHVKHGRVIQGKEV